jgi:hypothetical protein
VEATEDHEAVRNREVGAGTNNLLGSEGLLERK